VRQERKVVGHALLAEHLAHLGLVGAGAHQALAELVALAELEAQVPLRVLVVARLRRMAERDREQAHHLLLARPARRSALGQPLQHVAPLRLAPLHDVLAHARAGLALEAQVLVDHVEQPGVVDEASVRRRLGVHAHPERDGGRQRRRLGERRVGARRGRRHHQGERKDRRPLPESAQENLPACSSSRSGTRLRRRRIRE